MKNIKINTYTAYLAQIAVMLTSFFLSIILVNGLSTFEYGQYNIIVSFIVLLGTVSALGLEPVMTRYLAEFFAKKKFSAANRFISLVVLTRFMMLILVGLCVFLFKNYILKFYSLEIGIFLVMIIIIILILKRLYSLFGTAIVQAYFEIYWDSFFKIFYGLFRLGFFYIAISLDDGLSNILIAWVILELISFIYFLVICIKKINYNKSFSDDSIILPDERRRILKYVKYNILTSGLFIFADISVDIVVIGYYKTPSDVAIYAFATSLVMIVSAFNPVTLLKGLLTSHLTKIYVTSTDINPLLINYKLITKISIFLTLPINAVIFININDIIMYIYNEQYLSAVPLVRLAIIFFFVRGLSRTFTPLIESTEKNKLAFWAGIFSLYNLVMDIILIPRYGIYGALFATGSAGVFVFCLYYYNFFIFFKTHQFFPYELLYKALFLVLLLSAVTFLFKSYIVNVWLLFISMFLFVFLYVVSAFIFPIFNAEEKSVLINFFRKKKRNYSA